MQPLTVVPEQLPEGFIFGLAPALELLALVQLSIILAMGRVAVQSLIQSTDPIGCLRKQEHQYQGVRVIVTYPPAYLLHASLEKARAWEDLCLALASRTIA